MSVPDLVHPHRFIVGVDGSSAGRAALAWAAGVAAERSIPVHLVHVVEIGANQGLSMVLQEGADALLEAAVTSVGDAGVSAELMTWERLQGRPWELITAAADDPGDLIVIGSRGSGAYHRHLLGSTADRIVRLAGCPVLTITPDGIPGGGPIRRVVVGVDFSSDSDAALDAAAAIVGEGGTIIGVHASPPPVVVSDGPVTPLPDVDIDQMLDDARAGLEERMAERLPASIERIAVASPLYPVHAIEDAVREHDGQLVAVGTRGRTGLARMLLGSVSERVLHHVPCPTLVVHRRGGDD
jgi:nucleotide-binding universal stress UspA family protein